MITGIAQQRTQLAIQFLMSLALAGATGACSSKTSRDDEYLLRPVRVSPQNPPESALRHTTQDLQNSVRYATLSKNIRFDYASAELTASTKNALDTIANEINESLNSFEKIRLTGVTDSSGDDSRNMQLSERRAENVRRYLISKGVPANKVEAIGVGATNTIIPGTKIKAAADRRVDFEIVR
ncbi:OmpA family protein [Bdellovibrio sp. HCB209]|uniref:OmpA family protein n=1 Tax=Bdellovibrio sp. HCB209 TaxID=3394354 RepID=UPI0039B3D612